MKNSRGVIPRIIGLLSAFADSEPVLAISQLSARLGLPPSSVHRLLEQLVELEIIERASHRRYRIGPEFYRIGMLVERKFKIVQIALPFMQELADELNETCVLSVLIRSKLQRLRVAKVDPNAQPLRFRIQTPEQHSLVWGAAGRAILAYLTPDEIRQAHAEAPALSPTGRRLFSLGHLEKSLEQVRSRGYAFARGEVVSGDTIAMAVPLFSSGHIVIGEICIPMPAFRFEDAMLEATTSKVIRTASQLSLTLGTHVVAPPRGPQTCKTAKRAAAARGGEQTRPGALQEEAGGRAAHGGWTPSRRAAPVGGLTGFPRPQRSKNSARRNTRSA